MPATHIWNKLYLLSAKTVAVLFILLAASGSAHAQKFKWAKKNNPNYDSRRLTYGFLIGLHTSAYRIQYADKFVSRSFDSLYAVDPEWSTGFSLGFIVNYRLTDFLDLRLTPEVAFYEHRLKYSYTDKEPAHEELVETTMVEFPILLKYKSERRGNVRMYMVGGVKPGIEASGKKDLENVTSSLEVKGANLNLDLGFGFDLYYPLFKFSPEIRFSKGIMNVLDNTNNPYGQPLKRISTNTITVYLLFQ
jgi:hypothetical protein